jgi:hypothetical protein
MFSVDTEHRTREVEHRAAYLQTASRIKRKNILKGTVIYHKRKFIMFGGPFNFFLYNYIVKKKLYIGLKLKIEPREAFMYIIF